MRIVFVGSRKEVLKEIINSKIVLICSYVTENSQAEQVLKFESLPYKIINHENKNDIFQNIRELDFDLLVSNGCPYIIPVSKIKKKMQTFINIHPSLLPSYKGRHPITGVLLNDEKFTGVSCHIMDDEIDNGHIIFQEKIDISDDIDLALLYQICFDLEARVFNKSFEIIQKGIGKNIQKDHNYKNSYYSRKKKDRLIAYSSMTTRNIFNIIRAFSSENLGAFAYCKKSKVEFYESEIIINKYLLLKYKEKKSGEILLIYPNGLLVKTIDGIIKIRKFKILRPLHERSSFE